MRAVQEGYGSRLEERRVPLFVLHLALAPHLVDVNVHPQKREVRFAEESPLFGWVKRAVERALGGEVEGVESVPAPLPWESNASQSVHETPLFASPSLPLVSVPSPLVLLGNTLLFDGRELPEAREALVAVDMRAIQAELLARALQPGEVARQALLLPLTLHLSDSEEKTLLAQRAQLMRIGFEIRLAGKGVLFVETLPEAVEESEVKELLLLLCQRLDEGELDRERVTRIATKLVEKRARQMLKEEAFHLFQRALAGREFASLLHCYRLMGKKEFDEIFRKS